MSVTFHEEALDASWTVVTVLRGDHAIGEFLKCTDPLVHHPRRIYLWGQID